VIVSTESPAERQALPHPCWFFVRPRLRSSRHDATYFHYPHPSNQKGSPSSAIRKGDHKPIVFFNDGHRELYDLKQDIGEKQDLAGRMPDLANSLHDELKSWWKEVDARFPEGFATDYDVILPA
jgi:hypothetical protein